MPYRKSISSALVRISRQRLAPVLTETACHVATEIVAGIGFTAFCLAVVGWCIGLGYGR